MLGGEATTENMEGRLKKDILDCTGTDGMVCDRVNWREFSRWDFGL